MTGPWVLALPLALLAAGAHGQAQPQAALRGLEAAYQGGIREARKGEPINPKILASSREAAYTYQQPLGDALCFRVSGQEICSPAGTTKDDINSAIADLGTNFRVPDFAIIGYSQGGTTFFSQLLHRHSKVGKSCRTPRENHFFDRLNFSPIKALREERHNTEPLDITQYFQCLAHSEEVIVGDYTPRSIYSDSIIPVWMRAVNPDLKIIVLLRDPIKRTYSRYAMRGGDGDCASNIDQNLCKHHFSSYIREEIEYLRKYCQGVEDPDNIFLPFSCAGRRHTKNTPDTILSSLYGHHLGLWLSVFPKEQFLFVHSEDVFHDPQNSIDETSDFLGIPRESVLSKSSPRVKHNSHKRSNSGAMDEEAIELLEEFFAPTLQRTYELTGIRLYKDKKSTGTL